ncbi:MAG: SGNH/GDSL hydrolase family protein [Clostridia bacterium]|nr:SGNH/GDSL hydrolase family protein [Clostridia bacterium]
MKIIFFGDSITDAGRNRDDLEKQSALGYGYVRAIGDRLLGEAPDKHVIYNMGISGNRIVDLYARIKAHVWNREPDLISILIGINDVWHEINHGNGVDVERFEKVFRMIIEDTKKRLPNVQFVLCEPFVEEGTATCPTDERPERYELFKEIYDYARVVERLAKEYGCYYLPLQKKFDDAVERIGVKYYIPDGVHPNVGGSALIATEWMKLFKEQIDK